MVWNRQHKSESGVSLKWVYNDALMIAIHGFAQHCVGRLRSVSLPRSRAVATEADKGGSLELPFGTVMYATTLAFSRIGLDFMLGQRISAGLTQTHCTRDSNEWKVCVFIRPRFRCLGR
jgi:hypothetical protein